MKDLKKLANECMAELDAIGIQYGNRATIQEKFLLPFMGSQYKEKAFVLSLYSDYDDGFMYHRSVHESLTLAEKKLHTFSNGTFKEV